MYAILVFSGMSITFTTGLERQHATVLTRMKYKILIVLSRNVFSLFEGIACAVVFDQHQQFRYALRWQTVHAVVPGCGARARTHAQPRAFHSRPLVGLVQVHFKIGHPRRQRFAYEHLISKPHHQNSTKNFQATYFVEGEFREDLSALQPQFEIHR